MSCIINSIEFTGNRAKATLRPQALYSACSPSMGQVGLASASIVQWLHVYHSVQTLRYCTTCGGGSLRLLLSYAWRKKPRGRPARGLATPGEDGNGSGPQGCMSSEAASLCPLVEVPEVIMRRSALRQGVLKPLNAQATCHI